jgi:hypothetical protein
LASPAITSSSAAPYASCANGSSSAAAAYAKNTVRSTALATRRSAMASATSRAAARA